MIDPENGSIEQITDESSTSESRVQKLRNIAMKAHLEARQGEDLRRDIASSLRFITGDYSIGDKCWLWLEDTNKIKAGAKYGKWERATVIANEGPMVTANSVGKGVMGVDQSKRRKDADEWCDV